MQINFNYIIATELKNTHGSAFVPFNAGSISLAYAGGVDDDKKVRHAADVVDRKVPRFTTFDVDDFCCVLLLRFGVEE